MLIANITLLRRDVEAGSFFAHKVFGSSLPHDQKWWSRSFQTWLGLKLVLQVQPHRVAGLAPAFQFSADLHILETDVVRHIFSSSDRSNSFGPRHTILEAFEQNWQCLGSKYMFSQTTGHR